MTPSRPQTWDIFCRVIDNFGDIGVSWRLARQLASEHGLSVRLWVDDMASLQALHPSVRVDASQQVVDGVTVFAFADESGYAHAADVVIEAFGCGLPQAYVSAMAVRGGKPALWIVLEYLSAESWVRDHHGLPSPHPRLNIPRYFFFPGVADGTGGVLRERDLLARRDAFDARARAAWWARAGFDDVPPGATAVSLFAYAQAPVAALLEACAEGASPVVMAIPEGPLAVRVRDALRHPAGNRAKQGSLEVRFVPFVPQAEYDELLWACDLNFVRGEDSFVRAQWAGAPFVWQVYPQADNAHVAKLNAFLDAYSAGCSLQTAQAIHGLWYAWNGVAGAPPMAAAWPAFVTEFSAQKQGLRQWQRRLMQIGDAAGNLVQFCQKMI